jgi:diguanylate cyclase (GGDEF)-like protein/PAS domain S-box-containing protein
MIAALPENESDRLRALQETGLLDTSPEDDFDALVRLASIICETPIALLTLVDSTRQWFKAAVGLGSGGETARSQAFCAHAILHPEILLVRDALEDPRFADNPSVLGDPNIRFYAGLPLETTDGFRLGTLCVIDRASRELSPAQLEALHLLGRQANKQIDLRRQQHVLEQALVQGDLVERELRADQGLFHAFMDNSPFLGFMKDTDGRLVYYNRRFAEHFHLGRESGLGKRDDELWPPVVAARLRTNDLSVLRQWKMMVLEDETEFCKEIGSRWRSYKFPFRDSGGREYVAAFSVDITADKCAEEQLKRYQQALVEANEKLHALAVTDGLTGLLNRRAFESALDHEFAVANRYIRPLTLMIVDIDNFKSINDTFGHEEGDRVLQSIAGMIGRGFRETDIVARYGGEEFGVILPNTPKQSAVESAERLRRAVGESTSSVRRITISIGMASLEGTKCSKSSLVRRADEALYQAKREGKDRVCMSL